MKFLKFWFPVILYSGIIYYVSSWSDISIPAKWKFDKVLHVAEYFPLGFLAARALASTSLKSSWILPGAVLYTIFYGMTDEYHQLFVMGRSFEVFDIFADLLGGAAGAGIYVWIRARWLIDRKVE